MHNRHLAMDTNYDLWILNILKLFPQKMTCNLRNMISKFMFNLTRSFLEIFVLVATLSASFFNNFDSFLKNHNLKNHEKIFQNLFCFCNFMRPPDSERWLSCGLSCELSLVAANCSYRIFRHLSEKILLTFAWFTHILSNTKFSCIKNLKVVTWHHHKPSKC